jgi:hypothetical protein
MYFIIFTEHKNQTVLVSSNLLRDFSNIHCTIRQNIMSVTYVYVNVAVDLEINGLQQQVQDLLVTMATDMNHAIIYLINRSCSNIYL